eukprot:scaffold1880_cov207-Alexandrium_tamarense.AAC.11
MKALKLRISVVTGDNANLLPPLHQHFIFTSALLMNPCALHLPPNLALSNVYFSLLRASMIEVISFTLGYSSRRRTASIGFTRNTTSSICQTGTQAAVSYPIYNKFPIVATRAPESRGSRINSGIGISLLTGVMNPKISLAAQCLKAQ